MNELINELINTAVAIFFYITTPPFGHPLGFAFSPLRSA
jgi:hypothetical protein